MYLFVCFFWGGVSLTRACYMLCVCCRSQPPDQRFGILGGMTQICNTVPVAMRLQMLQMTASLGIQHFRDFPQLDLLRPVRKSPLATKNLLEDTGGLRRPP